MFDEKSRFGAAAVGVWERSHREYAGWPPAEQAVARAAIESLSAQLAECADEHGLHEQYWAFGDPLGQVLQAQLPPGFDPERLLTLEEACLWLRLLELRGTPPCST